MVRYRFLAAACVGTLFYVVVSICCGRNSVWAERQLDEQKRVLSMHTAEIEKTNDELNLEKVALEKDMDVIAAYARKLSYVSEGEKLVKVSGLAVHEHQMYDPGTIMLHTEVKHMPEWFCKGVGLIVFSLVYALLLLFDVSRGLIQMKMPRTTPLSGVSAL